MEMFCITLMEKPEGWNYWKIRWADTPMYVSKEKAELERDKISKTLKVQRLIRINDEWIAQGV